jgi:flagellar biosynthesis/type III secretory pathway protein FliH
LLVFGRLRNLQEKIQEIMNSVSKYIDIKEDFLYKQGLEEGVEKGVEQGVEKVVVNFLMKSNLSIEQIADFAGVSLTYVIAIKQKHSL